MRAFIIALCLFLMALLGWFFHSISHQCCGEGSVSGESTSVNPTEKVKTPAAAIDDDKRKNDCLMFNWANEEPILQDNWEQCKADLVARLKNGEFMEITGQYRSDETNSTSFEDLGLARANKVKELLSPPIDGNRVTLKSKLVNDNVDKNNLFTSVEYRNYQKTASIDQSIADRTIIRFPFNSTNKLNDSNVERYLDQVATRVKTSGERIRLTGHTDNIGSTASNITLGQRRADIINNYLISKGVASAKIITNSKGEASPMATNNTGAGRAENRRTELQIIK